MNHYSVKGMACAACSAKVEKAVSELPGVKSCAVSLLTNSMSVEGNVSEEAVIRAVEAAGFSASPDMMRNREEALKDTTTPKLKKRLIWSLLFLVILMYFAMGHNMFGAPLPKYMELNPASIGLVQMVLSTIILVINRDFFIKGFKGAVHLAPNMDTLVAMGSGISYLWSIVILVQLWLTDRMGDTMAAIHMLHGLYFESAAMIVTLITVGKMLESMSKGKTTDALRGMMKLAPETATILFGPKEKEKTVPVEKLEVGTIFIVRPGERIPVDGVIVEGETSVDESALSGESLPVDKNTGDEISAGTINLQGFIKVRASRVGEDTSLAKIIQLMSEASATKAPAQRLADKVASVFVPAVIALAVIVVAIWMMLGQDFDFAISRGIAVLVISCPCALGLATPVAIMVGSGVGARNGILFKTASALELIGKADVIALDKTGTITTGTPVITDVIVAKSSSEEELFEIAGALEGRSEHPLAKAITARTKNTNIRIADFATVTGQGLRALVTEGGNAVLIAGGKIDFIRECIDKSVAVSSLSNDELKAVKESLNEAVYAAEELGAQGKSPMFFSKGARYLGMIAVADPIKEDSRSAIRALKEMGRKVVMISGDKQSTAEYIASLVGVDSVVAEVMPNEKDAVIRGLQKDGLVAMVGDGINDAPALITADIGVAIGAGTDIAIDAADVVLMNNKLSDVCAAVRLGKKTLRIVKQNLFWAFIYNILLIPLAAGLYATSLGGWNVSPALAAAAMSISSFTVCMNALRLNGVNIHE